MNANKMTRDFIIIIIQSECVNVLVQGVYSLP